MTKLKCISQNEQPIPIPDHDDQGLESQIVVYRSGSIQSLELNVDIEHAHIGDLEVQLIAPNGLQIALHNREGGDDSQLKANYTGEIFDELIGNDFSGTWKLIVKDHAYRDAGHLNSWDLVFPYDQPETIARNIIPPLETPEVEASEEVELTEEADAETPVVETVEEVPVLEEGETSVEVEPVIEMESKDVLNAIMAKIESIENYMVQMNETDEEVKEAIDEIAETQEEIIEEISTEEAIVVEPEENQETEEIIETVNLEAEVDAAIEEIMEAQEEVVEEIESQETETEIDTAIEEIMEAQEEVNEEDPTENVEADTTVQKPNLEEILAQLKTIESMIISSLSSNEVNIEEVAEAPVSLSVLFCTPAHSTNY